MMNESALDRADTDLDLERASLSLADEVGEVYFTRNQVLRGIRLSAEESVRALLVGGLLDELTQRGWIPTTRISPVALPGRRLTLEHERLEHVTYPYEWSFEMLRAAALRVLEINRLANAYGWELKDCHGFNVVFRGAEPMFVDIGSFVRRPAGARGWLAEEQFMQCFRYPLAIWSDGSAFLARRLLMTGDLAGHGDMACYRHPVLRLGGVRAYERILRNWYRLRLLTRFSDDSIRARRGPVAAALFRLLRRMQSIVHDRGVGGLHERACRGLRRRNACGRWSDYQDTGMNSVRTPRFDRIVEIVRSLGARSLIDLGGNQGWLGQRLLDEGAAGTVVSVDADEVAIDRAYRRCAMTGSQLSLGVIDIVRPYASTLCSPPAERLRCEVAMSLAVSHHVILSQGFPAEHFLRSVASFARRYVLVEFMPRGLWDGSKAPPVPEWYTREWFAGCFARCFVDVVEEQLEENRILFRGRLKGTGQ